MHPSILPVGIALQAGIPVVAVGGPGCAKSTVINGLGKSLDLPVETVIASLREPSDFAGLPYITERGVELAAPTWAKRLVASGKGILFLDEISTAAPAVQAALLRVVLDRVVGDLPLPAGVAIVAAMNPPEQAAGGWELSPPLANRFCRIAWPSPSVADWADGMLQGFPEPRIPRLPSGWREANIRQARAYMAGFNQHKGTALYRYPKTEAEAGLPWPSPRTWDMAATLYAACLSVGVGKDIQLPLVGGCIGEGMALELCNWIETLDLPDVEEMLANPERYKVPERGDVAYTFLASVAAHVTDKMTNKRIIAAFHLFGATAKAGKKDYGAASIRALASAVGKEGHMKNADVREAVAADIAPYTDLLKKAGIM